MEKSNIWVIPHQKGWAVKKEHSGRASFVGKNKKELRIKAIEIAKKDKVELIVQKRNGVIGEKNSYGGDSCPPRG